MFSSLISLYIVDGLVGIFSLREDVRSSYSCWCWYCRWTVGSSLKLSVINPLCCIEARLQIALQAHSSVHMCQKDMSGSMQHCRVINKLEYFFWSPSPRGAKWSPMGPQWEPKGAEGGGGPPNRHDFSDRLLRVPPWEPRMLQKPSPRDPKQWSIYIRHRKVNMGSPVKTKLKHTRIKSRERHKTNIGNQHRWHPKTSSTKSSPNKLMARKTHWTSSTNHRHFPLVGAMFHSLQVLQTNGQPKRVKNLKQYLSGMAQGFDQNMNTCWLLTLFPASSGTDELAPDSKHNLHLSDGVPCSCFFFFDHIWYY